MAHCNFDGMALGSTGNEMVITRLHPVGTLNQANQANHEADEMMELRTLPDTITDTALITRKPRSTLRLLIVLIGLYLALFIAALDQTIITTAIPTIVSDLHSSSGYVWIGGAYLLANAAAGPIWAKFSDIWGRKFLLLSAVMLFFCSSVLCATAVSIKMLIIGRALQGTAGGGLIQLVLIIISDIFSLRERSLYLGLTEIMWAIAGSVGPILGGAFTEKLSWRWVFWINLPICGTTFILLLLFLDVHNPKTGIRAGLKAVDWFGSLSILGLTLMLLIGLEFGGAKFPWKSPQVICLVVIGSLMSIVFIYSEKRLAQYPLMPLSLFNDRSNVASFFLTFAQGMVFIAAEYYLPLFFQSALGANPLRSGVLILPITVSEALMGITAGIMIHRTGRYLELIYIGVVLMTIGNGLYILFDTTTTIACIIGFELVAGLGAGLLFEPPLIALHALVDQENIATATATMGFVRNLATSFSIVIGGVVFQNSMDLKIKTLSSPPISLPHNITEQFSGSAAAGNVLLVAQIADIGQRTLIREAFAWSLSNLWIMYTCISFLAVLSSFFVKRSVLSEIHVETETGIKEKKPLMS